MRKIIVFCHFNLLWTVFFGCNADKTIDEGKTKEEIEVIKGPSSEFGVYENDKAFDIVAEDNSGNSIRLSDYLGNTVILYFWTSWSEESMVSNKILVDIEEMYEGIEIISINIIELEEKNLEYVIKLIRKESYPYNVYFDFESNISEKYLLNLFPTTYIIDGEGYIKNIISGKLDKEQMVNKIDEILEPQ